MVQIITHFNLGDITAWLWLNTHKPLPLTMAIVFWIRIFSHTLYPISNRLNFQFNCKYMGLNFTKALLDNWHFIFFSWLGYLKINIQPKAFWRKRALPKLSRAYPVDLNWLSPSCFDMHCSLQELTSRWWLCQRFVFLCHWTLLFSDSVITFADNLNFCELWEHSEFCGP